MDLYSKAAADRINIFSYQIEKVTQRIYYSYIDIFLVLVKYSADRRPNGSAILNESRVLRFITFSPG